MKVIDEKIWWEFVCKACGSTCQAELDDVTSRPNIDCDGDVFNLIPTVECGKCGKSHDVPSKKITDKIIKIGESKNRK